jgi:hypothetical protein
MIIIMFIILTEVHFGHKCAPQFGEKLRTKERRKEEERNIKRKTNEGVKRKHKIV